MAGTYLKLADNALTTLNGSLTASATEILVVSVSDMPSTYPYILTIWDGDTYDNPGDDSSMEKVLVTSGVTTTLTVTRGYDGTTGVIHSTAEYIALLSTSAILDDSTYGIETVLDTHIDDSSIHLDTDTVKDTHVDWGTGASQVSAVDMPIVDSGAKITATEVEGALQENRTAIDLNTAKETNVSTDLSEGTSTETTVDVDSSDGNNATLVSASTSRAGLLTKAKFDEIVINTSKETNITTDLSEGTSTETTVDVNSSDGTNATLVSASASRAGLLTKAKFDEIVSNNAKVTNATHSGDVTGDGELTIATDAVTYAKMQNIVNDERIWGRVSGADGVVEELTKAQVLTMLNVADGADVTSTNETSHADVLVDGDIGVTVAELPDDTAYNATSWDGNSDAATKNAIRDKIESMSAGGTTITAESFSESVAHLTTDADAGKAFTITSFPDHAQITAIRVRADWTAGQQADTGSALVNDAGGILPTDLSITYDNAVANFAANDYAWLEDECVFISADSGTVLTVTRGAKGTSAVFHDDNTTIVKANHGVRLVLYKDTNRNYSERIIELSSIMTYKGVTDDDILITGALTGTVTFTNASTAVSGSGTAFTTEVNAGSIIKLDADGTYVVVASVTDDTNLVLIDVYSDTGGSGASTRGDATHFGLTADIKNLGHNDFIVIEDTADEICRVQVVNHDTVSAVFDYTIAVQDALAAHAVTKDVKKLMLYDLNTAYDSGTTLYGTVFIDEKIAGTVNVEVEVFTDSYT